MSDGASAAVAAAPWDLSPDAAPIPPKADEGVAPKGRRKPRAARGVEGAPSAGGVGDGPQSSLPPAQTPAPVPADLRRIPLDRLVESPHNPRQHFDAQQLRDLADSLRAMGQLTPCLVRPTGSGVGVYELAAGHRRFRAARLAGLDALLCVVRPMTDEEFLTCLVLENDQREDVHPLEEASGYATLLKSCKGYDVARIAERVGRSVKYVYDRMKLLQLTAEAKALFLKGRFEAGHAILLARLTPAQQKAALETQRGGLFDTDLAGDVDADGRPVQVRMRFGALVEGGNGKKPASVREFATWINDHVRLTEAAAADPVLFPEQAALLAEAVERKLKVVHISQDHQLHPDARLEGQRTYGPMSWAYADGQEHRPEYGGKAKVAKTCPHAVLGLVVAGEGRGGMFQVCIAKEKCATHWPEQVKKTQARKAGTTTSAGGGSRAAEVAREKRERERVEREQAERKHAEKRWTRALPALRAAAATRIAALPTTAAGPLARLIFDRYGRENGKPLIPLGETTDDLVRHLAGCAVGVRLSPWSPPDHFAATARVLGLDVAKLLNAADPAGAAKVKPQVSDKKAGAKKGKAKKGKAQR